jgi:predicted nucleic acid-binding protein
MNSPIVLDTSVILKWFKKKDESHVDSAKYFLSLHQEGHINICVSSVMPYELYNTLSRYIEFKAEDIEQLLLNIGLSIYDLGTNRIKLGFDLVRTKHISFYDASYVALAESLGCDLITADKKLVKAVSLPFVKLLT